MPFVLAAFEQALAFLDGAPLSSPDIRKSLDQALEEWQRMLPCVARPAGEDARLALACGSERLLELFDGLTERYERSMQVLTG